MSETKKIWKWFWAWEFEKEEQWLNEMAMAGWVLKKVGIAQYYFERCNPGEYIVRLEMHNKDDNYIEFMEEIGATYIDRFGWWIFFCRKAELGPFDIFSDIDSRINHLKRISNLLLPIGIVNLLYGLIPVNGISWMNTAIATIIMYGLGRLHGKKEELEKERSLHE